MKATIAQHLYYLELKLENLTAKAPIKSLNYRESMKAQSVAERLVKLFRAKKKLMDRLAKAKADNEDPETEYEYSEIVN